ncbi:hypothetical protein G7Z17_g374 [Cylindrodendrum hubeiense]|uniref:Uncharacterized protein n=1 Tax=Cylindrodendrum hubeiense TaxID=595255 RepID=A0A9P5HH08_9HYPO|nr:hypothetical protein G7Z17_g374 [Cylindrodendrum hubeiense]
MSRIVDDVKSGLKGIRGAGDVLRGGLMEATDNAFEPEGTVVPQQNKNAAVKEKGKQDIKGADEMVSRHEWERKNRAAGRQAQVAGAPTTRVPATGMPTSGGLGNDGNVAAGQITQPQTSTTYHPESKSTIGGVNESIPPQTEQNFPIQGNANY